jgi:hypothetical protein
MPTTETLEDFVAMVEANQHAEAVERFYTPNATLQDNQSPETRGKNKQIENEKNLLLKVKKMYSKCIRPYFIKDNYVIIKWHFRFDFKDETFIDIEEIAYQQWNGEQMEKEQFFFDPKQFISKPIE